VTQDEIDALYRRWRKPIRKWLSHRSTISRADLDDISHEVFLRLLRYGNSEMINCPQGYLFQIANNVANEWIKRSCRRQPHKDEWLDDLTEDDARQPEFTAERESEDRAVGAAVNELPNRAGVILLMHVNDGKTYKQIAAELGVTYRTVLRDLTNAYSQLRVGLKDERWMNEVKL
jgi:RNA polymerase sigma factor (sigma-70 family)